MRMPIDTGRIALAPASGSTVFTGRYTRHRFAPHFHREFTIGVIETGACAFLCDGRPRIARAGQAFFINPHVVHTGTPAGEELRYRVVHPSAALMRQALQGQSAHLVFCQPVIADVQTARTVSALLDADDDTGKAAAAIRALASAHGQASAPLAPLPPVVAQACAWLTAHWSEPFDLTRTAAALGISRYHFSRLFHRITGLTPSAYHRLVRLDRARQAIVAGLPLTEVALAAGFADQSHFTHAFKAITGVTPAVYARGIRQVQAPTAADTGAGKG